MLDIQIENKIRVKAKEINLSIRQLCKEIKMSQPGFYSALKKNTLRIETLSKIAEVLKVDISYFFTSENSLPVVELEQKIKDQKKIIAQLQTKVDGNKTDLFIAQSEFFEFAKNIWNSLNVNHVFKNKKTESDFREIFYAWLYRMQYNKETISNIRDKEIYQLFSKLFDEAEMYWNEFLKNPGNSKSK